MAATVHRTKITRVLKTMSKVDLADALQISRPTLYKIIDGYDPHEGICEFINARLDKLLSQAA